MRRLLISAAALALMAAPFVATPAFAQNGHRDRDQGGAAPAQAQPAPQAAPAPQPAPAPPQNGLGHGHRDVVQGGGNRGGNGGPTSFSNGMPQSPGAPQAAAPQNRGDQNRGDRGNFQDRRGQDNNRPDNRTFNGAGNGSGNRPDNRYDNRPDNRFGNGYDNRGRSDYRSGNDNRGFNRPDYRPGNGFDSRRPGPGYGGPRHDFSGFRDFHRDFRASRHFRAPNYRRPAGWYDHRWTFGEFLPSAFWARDYWLSDFGDYDLPPPPYGAVWVRVGNDALMIDEDSGEVITVEYDVFY